ncbi:MAG: hypothetical protein Tsb0014_35940 [Pleurocapsa sp.]
MQNLQANWKQSLQQLQTYLYDENWQGTIKLCEQITSFCQQQIAKSQEKINNIPGLIYLEQGDISLQKNQIEEAIAFYQRAITINPHLSQGEQKLAEALSINKHQLISQGKIPEAIAIYQRAIELHPQLAEIRASLGNLYAKNQQWDDAIATYQQALELNPQLAKVYFNLGTIFTKMGQPELSPDYWYQALTLNPTLLKPKEYLNLGHLLANQQKPEQAINCFERAISLQPNLTIAYSSLGQLLIEQGRIQDAIALYQQLSSRNGNNAETQVLLGQALAANQQWSEAILCYRQAIAIQPDLAKAYSLWGNVLKKQKQWSEAEHLYYRCLEINPHDFASRQELIQVYLQQRQWEKIITLCRESLVLNPDESNLTWIYTHLGNALTQVGETEAAIDCHRQTAKLRGWLFYDLKKYQFTRDWFTHNIAIWEQHLAEFKNVPHLHILEIGSFEGMATCWLLDHILSQPSSTITCIDPQFQPNFALNIAKTNSAPQVTRLEGNSHQILPTLSVDYYQIIYIDGCHLADHVQKDAELSWNLLQVGGLMIFDDYEWSDPQVPQQDPKLGINKFLNSTQGHWEILVQGYQLIIRKTK